MNNNKLFGQGLGFPPRVGADGRLAWAVGEQNVRESIRLILLTEPGERLMREEFGCGLRQFLFEPNTVATRKLIQEQINEAIRRWEPRVKVEELIVSADPNNLRLINISILFRLIATQSLERLGLSFELEG
ncbi:MAG: phage tail protein [Chloroflexi bacterium]|nr:MAG: phage tail protein [Chloroflexota bacterium]